MICLQNLLNVRHIKATSPYSWWLLSLVETGLIYYIYLVLPSSTLTSGTSRSIILCVVWGWSIIIDLK